MAQSLTDPTLRALRRILRATELGARKLAAETGLTPSQILVLQDIERRGETMPSRVAAELQFSQATVTNIVDRLEERGLVTRRRGAEDRRQSILAITDAGRSLLATAPGSVQEAFRSAFGTLPAWEQAMILAGLERIGELLDADDIEAAPLIDAGAIDRKI